MLVHGSPLGPRAELQCCPRVSPRRRPKRWPRCVCPPRRRSSGSIGSAAAASPSARCGRRCASVYWRALTWDTPTSHASTVRARVAVPLGTSPRTGRPRSHVSTVQARVTVPPGMSPQAGRPRSQRARVTHKQPPLGRLYTAAPCLARVACALSCESFLCASFFCELTHVRCL